METASSAGIVLPVQTHRPSDVLAGIAGAVLIIVGVFVPWASSDGVHVKLLQTSDVKHTFALAISPLVVGVLVTMVILLPLAASIRRGALLAFGIQSALFYFGYMVYAAILHGFIATSLIGIFGGILVFVSGILIRGQ